MEKVRWGVLGTANIARTQVIPAIMRATNAEIVGIASRGDRAKEIATALSIPKHYDSYDKLLCDGEIDAVYIPLPNHLHKDWVIKAAKHKKHVLCEKPAALTHAEVLEMVESCKTNHVQFLEAFMYQFHPQHERAHQIIAAGEIGEVKFMRASFSYFLDNRDSNIRMKKEMGGGSIYDIGCYTLQAIRHILKMDPTELRTYANIDQETGVDTSAIIYMKLPNGINAVLDCSFEMTFRHEYEIVGTMGKITVPRAFRPDIDGGEGLIMVQSSQGTRIEKIIGDQYRNQMEHFSHAILHDLQPSYQVESIINNMRMIDACYQSIKNNSDVIFSSI